MGDVNTTLRICREYLKTRLDRRLRLGQRKPQRDVSEQPLEPTPNENNETDEDPERRTKAIAQVREFLAHGDAHAVYHHTNVPRWVLREQIRLLQGLRPERFDPTLSPIQAMRRRLWFITKITAGVIGAVVLVEITLVNLIGR